MSNNDRTTDLRRDRPDSDRREGGSVRDLRARRESNRQSVMGRLTVPGAARRQESPAAHGTVTLREPDQLPLPGFRPVNDRDQEKPPSVPSSPEESQSVDPSPATALAETVSLAPPPVAADDRRPRRGISTDAEPVTGASSERKDMRRRMPASTQKHNWLHQLVAAASRRRRTGLAGLALLATVIAAGAIATAVLSTSGSPSGSHRTRVESASFAGQDPRSTEQPKAPPPQLQAHGLRNLGTSAADDAALIKRRPPDHASTTAPAAPTTTDQPTETTTYQPAETASTPSYTPAPTTTTPSPSSGGGSSSSGGGSTSGGGSSSSSTKTPAYGPTGGLGPGSSPDG